jgi:diaminobutyrate-2-oxoglutarate transaminase
VLTRVVFGGRTGSDAVESALKLANLNSGRTSIIAFEGAYHGMTSGALSLGSGSESTQGRIEHRILYVPQSPI